jgi:hypothetical protein
MLPTLNAKRQTHHQTEKKFAARNTMNAEHSVLTAEIDETKNITQSSYRGESP